MSASSAMHAAEGALQFARLRAARPFFLFAGPNVIESRGRCLAIARSVAHTARQLGIEYVFKASFDKANRTSASSFRGPGLAAGLDILRAVKEEVGVPVVTDIHEPWQAERVAQVADVLQIPAFLCRQTDLLVAAAETGRVVHVKKGQWCAPEVMTAAADKLRRAGNPHVIVSDRGTSFGYSDLLVDPRSLMWLRDAGGLVSADVTHSLQQPGGQTHTATGAISAGGLRELIPAIARTAVAVGVDGLFMEVHDDPCGSPCDAPTQWPLRHLPELLRELVAIAAATKGREPTEPLNLEPMWPTAGGA